MNTYGYKLHDWQRMGDKKKNKIIQINEAHQARKKSLQEKGYEIFCSFKAGNNSSYSFSKDGKNSGLAFEFESSVMNYIETHQL